MSSIPEDLCREILLRLPVKSLFVFKSVSKKWYALISSSDFVKTHVSIHKNKPILMLEGSIGGNHSVFPYSITYDSFVSSSIVVEDDMIDAIEMDYPFKSLGYDTVQLSGSSNGLICMRLFNFERWRNVFCLWNPATREYKEIPESPIRLRPSGVRLHAFGYDVKADDYKLAIGLDDDDDKNITQIHVYTLASNSWRTGKTVPYRFAFDHFTGVHFNGELHWLATAQSIVVLLSLDIGDENFKELQLPPKECLEMKKDPYTILGVLEGQLSLLVSSYVNGVRIHFEVWEMLDYGVRESWTRRYIITHESICKDRKYPRLMFSFDNGKILFLISGSLVFYDTEHGSARQLNIRNIYFRETVNYFESLVSLKSGNYLGGRQENRGVMRDWFLDRQDAWLRELLQQLQQLERRQ